jgi:hypothetical protein
MSPRNGLNAVARRRISAPAGNRTPVVLQIKKRTTFLEVELSERVYFRYADDPKYLFHKRIVTLSDQFCTATTDSMTQ